MATKYPEMACGGETCPASNPFTCKKPCDYGNILRELISRAPKFVDKMPNQGTIVMRVEPRTRPLQPIA